jgi:hypothetical protein
MNSRLTFTWEQAKQMIEEAIFAHFGESLKEIQLSLLQDSWDGLNYQQISQKHHLSVNYLRGDVGPKLWHKLSIVLKKDVTKTNFKSVLEQIHQNQFQIESSSFSIASIPLTDFPFPEGSVPPNSPFYQERGIESFCYQVIRQPGALLQVRSPQRMGKTSLLKKILDQAKLESYQTLYLDLWRVEPPILVNWHHFLQWFCFTLAKELHLEDPLFSDWDTSIWSSSDHCKNYFENYILPSLEQPLVLALDDLDQIFLKEEMIHFFLRMIRSWHEEAKSSSSWQKLRLVIAYSTATIRFWQIDPTLLSQGVLVELGDFHKQQIDNLVRIHQLSFSDEKINSLMAMLGGHPYLIRMALYQLKTTALSLEDFLQEISISGGIYHHYLDQQIQIIKDYPELSMAFKRILAADHPILLNQAIAYRLWSLGLVKKQGHKVMIKYHLYHHYFKNLSYFIPPMT